MVPRCRSRDKPPLRERKSHGALPRQGGREEWRSRRRRSGRRRVRTLFHTSSPPPTAFDRRGGLPRPTAFGRLRQLSSPADRLLGRPVILPRQPLSVGGGQPRPTALGRPGSLYTRQPLSVGRWSIFHPPRQPLSVGGGGGGSPTQPLSVGWRSPPYRPAAWSAGGQECGRRKEDVWIYV